MPRRGRRRGGREIVSSRALAGRTSAAARRARRPGSHRARLVADSGRHAPPAQSAPADSWQLERMDGSRAEESPHRFPAAPCFLGFAVRSALRRRPGAACLPRGECPRDLRWLRHHRSPRWNAVSCAARSQRPVTVCRPVSSKANGISRLRLAPGTATIPVTCVPRSHWRPRQWPDLRSQRPGPKAFRPRATIRRQMELRPISQVVGLPVWLRAGPQETVYLVGS
jgi:hypothetical protein